MVLVLPLDLSLISSVLTISHNAILASLISLYIHSPFSCNKLDSILVNWKSIYFVWKRTIITLLLLESLIY